MHFKKRGGGGKWQSKEKEERLQHVCESGILVLSLHAFLNATHYRVATSSNVQTSIQE